LSSYRPSLIGSALRAIAATPNALFDDARYEAEVLAPTRRLRKLSEEIGGSSPSDAQSKEIVDTLRGILEAKRVESDEIRDRLAEIVDHHELQSLYPELAPARSETRPGAAP
jgi:hypothetical protein